MFDSPYVRPVSMKFRPSDVDFRVISPKPHSVKVSPSPIRGVYVFRSPHNQCVLCVDLCTKMSILIKYFGCSFLETGGQRGGGGGENSDTIMQLSIR